MDSVLDSHLFETHVGKFPPLTDLFGEYEKHQNLFVKNLKMSDYDKSCNVYYEDSSGTSGDFDKEAYLEREQLYKVGVMKSNAGISRASAELAISFLLDRHGSESNKS